MNKKSNNGFTLIEVLIALFVSAIALLGLAAGQLKSMQYASNSFHYTVSVIQANNAIERMWNDICELEDGRQAFDDAYKATLAPQLTYYQITLPNSFNNTFPVRINWVDERMSDNSLNQVQATASFPSLPAGC